MDDAGGAPAGRGMLAAMAICVDCEREMTTAASCTVTTLHIGDLTFPMARHRRGGDGRCGDCGVEPGGYHHLGCDLARCPRCGRQLIGCGCPFDELDDGWDGDLDEGEDDIDGDDDEDAAGVGSLAWRQVCPRCGSRSVIPILYGISNPTAQALVDHGVLELGDPTAPAAVTDPTGATGARPTSRCRSCEHAWTTRRRSA